MWARRDMSLTEDRAEDAYANVEGPVETSTPCKNVTNPVILPPIDPVVDQDESVFMEVDHHEEING